MVVQIFSPQKGATTVESRAILEEGMLHIRDLIQRMNGVDLGSVMGSGAAGGMCGGFSQLCPRVEIQKVLMESLVSSLVLCRVSCTHVFVRGGVAV